MRINKLANTRNFTNGIGIAPRNRCRVTQLELSLSILDHLRTLLGRLPCRTLHGRKMKSRVVVRRTNFMFFLLSFSLPLLSSPPLSSVRVGALQMFQTPILPSLLDFCFTNVLET